MGVDDVLARVEKHYKRPILKRAGDSSSPFLLRRPTGIISLDIAMGGGWPAGGVSEIAGPPGAGKNALCLQTLRWCQRIYGDDAAIAWLTLELTGLDKNHAHLNDVKVAMSMYELKLENLSRKKQGRRPLTKSEIKRKQHQIGEFIIGDEGSTAERLQAAVELVQDNRCQIVVIDSLAALVSKARDETDLDDEPQQSAEARLATEFQKKLWSAYCNPENGDINLTTVLAINQVKANRAKRSPFDSDWVVAGAYAIKHGKLVDVWVKYGQGIYMTPAGNETAKSDSKNTKIGKQMRWQIAKGKAGCHEGPSGEVPYYFSWGFNVYYDLIITARSYGVIKIKGTKDSKTKKIKDPKFFMYDQDDEVINQGDGGMEELVEMVGNDSSIFDAIYWLTMRRAGVTCVHKI